MTHTTTDAAEARARLEAMQKDRSTEHGRAAFRLLRRLGGGTDHGPYSERDDWTTVFLATAEAASGAGEREATQDEYATVEDWEHDDQRELSLLYKHRADDSLQFNRGQMREAIRHGKRLASLPPATDPAKETIAFVQEWLMSSDHEPTQWDRDFAAAIDARASRQPTDADIRAMAQRFCSTPLPEGVSADLVAIKPMAGRTGTNLLTVEEAAIMLRAALAAAPAIPATGERWRHVKRGTVYEVIGEAKVQDAADSGITEGDVVVVYRGDDGQLWAREYSEFHDGRFATTPAIGHAATEGEG